MSSEGMKVPELKPCPFCGSSAEWYSPDEHRDRIQCSNVACPIRPQTIALVDTHRLPEVWNIRATDETECPAHEFCLDSDHALKRRAEVNERIAALTVERDRMRLDFENREAACCPEDVGFEEFIAVLKKKLGQAEAERDRMRDALVAFPKQADPNPDGDCVHGEEWQLCVTCKYEWEQALMKWMTKRNAVLSNGEQK